MNTPFKITRKLFCIKDGEVKTPPADSFHTHTEWFTDEGWIDENNVDMFLETVDRGYYFPENNTLYTYTGYDFAFTEKTVSNVKSVIPLLKEALHLGLDTKICFGPKDKVFNGREHPQLCIGDLKDIL
ncbi:hypothetical protein KW782_00790 [Candidatus Parcubacteria bacterium]|nr:hypothetical protein [Candidatus Parcubacteria bacterium]